MLFSKEMDNAEKYGYKFEILWGYQFNTKVVFKDYINDLYNLRLTYPKSDPMNFIAKILMNSLYGKFGMRDNFPITQIVNDRTLNKLLNDKNLIIDNIKELGSNNIIQYFKENNLEYETSNVNVAWSS